MKRLITAAALSLVVGSLVAGTAAEAAPPFGPPPGHDWRHHDRPDRDDHGWRDHHDDGPGRYDRHYYSRYHWDYDRGYRHSDWRRGGYVPRDYWARGRYIDYRYYHLRRPPRGYEWRYVDGDYVLAAVTTGLIASIVLSH